MEPGRFRKRPVVIEAVQLTYDNRREVAEWCRGMCPAPAPSGVVYALGLVAIETLEGTMWARDTDYVIKGVQGEFYPCRADIFEATYEPVTVIPPPTAPVREVVPGVFLSTHEVVSPDVE